MRLVAEKKTIYEEDEAHYARVKAKISNASSTLDKRTRKSLAMEEMVAKEGRDRSKLDLDHYSQEWPNICLSSMIGRLDKVSKSIYIHIYMYMYRERERERTKT